MTPTLHIVIPSRADDEGPSIVLLITQSAKRATASLCEVLRFAQDDGIENAGRI
jgi:hypothetical protein